MKQNRPGLSRKPCIIVRHPGGLNLCRFCLSILFISFLIVPVVHAQEKTHLTITASRNSPPLSFLDKDEAPRGILIDFWRLWAKKSGVEVTFILVDWEKTLDLVKNGQADIHAGLFSSEDRSAFMEFSSGFMEDTLSLFVFDKLEIQSIGELRDTLLPVGINREYYAVEYMKKTHPDVKIHLFPNNETLLRSALRQEILAFVVDYPVAVYYLSRNDALGKFRMVEDLSTQSLRAGVKKGNRKVLDLVENSLHKVGREELEELQNRWGLRGKKLFPLWLKRLLIGSGAGLAFMVLLANWALLRREVKRKTRELQEKNNALDIINRDMRAATQTVQSQIEALEKLSREKDDLLRIVGQGLRAPIQGIYDITRRGEPGDESIFQSIQALSEKMLILIDKLLQISKLAAENYHLEMKKVDLVEVFEKKRKAYKDLAQKKDLDFELALPSGPVEALVNPDHFDQICDNLFSNAVKFSHPGGRIRISLVMAGPDEERKVIIRFEDHGIGIPEPDLPLLFDRFTGITREGTQGEYSTGIGLALVKTLVELHRGTIRVQSRAGAGSVFIIEIPLFHEVVRIYDEVEANLQTGDLILFKGLYTNRMGETSVAPDWTHVGLVVKIPSVGEPFLWESTTLETIPDKKLRRKKTGPQLVSLKERLTSYETDVYAVRYLKTIRDADMLRNLYEFIHEAHRLPFPSELQVIRKVLRGKVFSRLWHVTTRFRSIFCTELIAESYIRMGLMPATPPSSAYLPPDFTSQRKLPLLKGAYLSNEVLIRLSR